jgi:hypothetical protein
MQLCFYKYGSVKNINEKPDTKASFSGKQYKLFVLVQRDRDTQLKWYVRSIKNIKIFIKN